MNRDPADEELLGAIYWGVKEWKEMQRAAACPISAVTVETVCKKEGLVLRHQQHVIHTTADVM